METKTFQYANTENKKGKFHEIEICVLVIPAEDEESCNLKKDQMFQRPEYFKNKEKAEKWDWLLCGSLTVALINNIYYVVDGGNRLRAARINGTIKKMPCMVYEGISLKNAAKGFMGIQVDRRNVNAIQKHKTNVMCGDPVALTIESIVSSYGYCISSTGSGEFVFDGVAALYSLIKSDKELANKAFGICAEIAEGSRIFKDLLFGVFELESRAILQRRQSIFSTSNIDKLKTMGVRSILGAVNGIKAISGSCSGTNSRKIAAKAIYDLINKGRSSGKIRINFD